MKRRLTLLLVGLASISASSCSRTVAASVDPVRPPIAYSISSAAIQASNRPNKDCWFVRMDKTAGISVWLSPRLSGETPSGFRFVAFTYHDPSAARPMATCTGVGILNRTDAIGTSNGAIRITVAPKSGLTWGEIEKADQLQVDTQAH